MNIKHVPLWQKLLAAAAGGSFLSVVEVYTLFHNKQGVDMYLMGAMIVASVLGIGGYYIVGATNIRSAFAAGISSQQVVGKLVNSGVQLSLMLSLHGTVYAAEPLPPVDSDPCSMTVQRLITVNLKGSEHLIQMEMCDGTVIDIEEGKNELFVPDHNTTLIFTHPNFPLQEVDVDKDIQVVHITISHSKPIKKFMTVMFAQKSKVKMFEKVEIIVE